MARKKLEIKASEEQINDLINSLKAGAPLQLALQRAAISVATYYYWAAISSIVVSVKSQEEIEEIEELAQSGVSIQIIRDMAQNFSKGKKNGVGTFIEPSQESILQYKNNKKFRVFADRCNQIISECDKARADFAALQLVKIARSTDKKNGINPSGAMWWLERNMPDQFAKPSDKVKEQENEADLSVPSIEVEFIDPETNATQQRLLDIEAEILKDQGGKA